jgi:hypothetical protein
VFTAGRFATLASDETSALSARDRDLIRVQAGTLASIADGHLGQIVTLLFTGAVTVSPGGNLRLRDGAVWQARASDTLQFVHDDVTWFELCRSVNSTGV